MLKLYFISFCALCSLYIYSDDGIFGYWLTSGSIVKIENCNNKVCGKIVTVFVDDDIDPNNAESVEYAMATRFQADKDLVIIKNVRGSSLDPSSDQKKLQTAKMGIDATRSTSKRPEGFEMAKIPKIDKIDLKKYFK